MSIDGDGVDGALDLLGRGVESHEVKQAFGLRDGRRLHVLEAHEQHALGQRRIGPQA